MRTVRRLSAVLLLSSFAFNTAIADDMLIPSLTLDDYTQKAIDEGVQGKENALTFESAGYSRQIAFRQTDSPTLSAGYTHTRSESKGDGIDTLTDNHESTLTLNQPTILGTNVMATGTYGDANRPGFNATATQPLYIFVWNPALRARRQAELSFGVAKDTFDSTILSLRTQARTFYYNVMQGNEAIQVAERKLQSSQKLLDVTQALVDAGKLAPVERMRAKIVVQTDTRQLENTTVSRDQALLQAKNFIYWPFDEPVHFTTRLQFRPFSVSLDRLVEYAMLHNPELRTLQRNQELARLTTQTAMETTRPTFSLNSGYSYVQADPLTVTHGWTLGGTANWLFFDSFVTRDKVRQARIAEAVADLNRADSERTIRVNVESAYLDVKRTEKQIVDFQSSREQAHHDVEVVRLRFQNGLERLIDVFDAENSMRDLDNEYLGLVVQFNQSKDKLTQLVGTDVERLR